MYVQAVSRTPLMIAITALRSTTASMSPPRAEAPTRVQRKSAVLMPNTSRVSQQRQGPPGQSEPNEAHGWPVLRPVDCQHRDGDAQCCDEGKQPGPREGSTPAGPASQPASHLDLRKQQVRVRDSESIVIVRHEQSGPRTAPTRRSHLADPGTSATGWLPRLPTRRNPREEVPVQG